MFNIVRPLLLFLIPFFVYAFDKEYCEFERDSYSLEWAYEPNAEKIVFVLKQNASEPEFWTGVGFNSSRGYVDFIGVLVRNGQVVMADAYLNGSGILYTDIVSNIQTIGYDYNGKSLLVKFARPLISPDMVNDQSLDGCTTFFLPREPGKIEANGIQPKLKKFHRFKVCDIKAHCSIDMSASVGEKLKPKKKPGGNQDPIQFAKSVDLSGSGDPCSFVGKNFLVNWTYAKETDRIHFVMEVPVKEKNWWSAVGIGEWMADMDAAVMFLEDGKVKKLGDYISSSYGVPDEDQHNDWKLESSKKSGKKAVIKFSRAVETKDKNDRSMDGCVLFQFGANLGKYEDDYLIQKHENWPDLYKACDLREYCAELNFEKRAKNRKDKNKNKEKEEQSTPETDESNDEKGEDESKQPTSDKPEESGVTTEKPADETTPKTSDNVTTTVSGSEESHEAKTTELAEELSEEVGSGEGPPVTTVGVKSTEISLNDSSGQEAETTGQTVPPSKLVTSAPETTPSSAETPKQESTTETTTSKPSEANTTASNVTVDAAKSGDQRCDPLKQDLSVCQSYMDNYLAQVREWAARHDETMEAQYGKACALLSAVPHVPTLCCHIFQKTCNSQISN